ncbi:MAG TPA: hypothetical protein VEG26_04230 [Steroidobacteraceae bacterium]|nr:hypothetical protein [Steroidobacteraceae bacterium]
MALLACSAISPADAGNLDFLKKTPAYYFKPEDTELMQKNAYAVLDSAEPAARREWSNPKTGASGLAEVRGQFTATDGAPCKRLRVVNRVKSVESDATYTVCKYPERGWIVNVDAQPAQ